MRVRITRSRSGIIDGVDLGLFHVDHIYEVDQSMASYLIVIGAAEPTLEDAPALVVRGRGLEVLYSAAPVAEPEMATDSEGGDDSA